MNHQTIVVLDFGSQFTQLIARRLRELSVYAEILPFDTPLEKIRGEGAGRHHPVRRTEERARNRRAALRHRVYDAGVPVLGICYGMQLMTHALGGQVAPAPHREFGLATISIDGDAPLFASDLCLRSGSSRELRVWASHGDFVKAAPAGFSVTATSANAPVAAMASPDRGLYALLFHPEVAHTDYGLEILRNFAFDVCGCTGDWTMKSFVQEATDRIRDAGGQRAGRLRPERWRGLDGRGGAHPSRDRRPADVHLRRQRRDAAGRSRADQAPVRADEAAAASLPTRSICSSAGSRG